MWPWVAAAAVVVGALVAWVLAGDPLRGSLDWLLTLDSATMRQTIEQMGPWAPLISAALMMLHTFVPFPLEILAAANGLVFGTVAGVALTWSSMVLSAWLGYGAARFANRLIFRIAPTERLQRMEEWAARRSGWQLVAVRFIPVISFSLLNLALGLLRVPFWRFTWTTALGIIPIVVVSVVSGHLLRLGPWGWAAVGALVVGIVAVEIYRHRRNKEDAA